MASLIQARSSHFARAREGTTGQRRVAPRAIYATIIVNGHLPPGRATPPHRQNQLDVAYSLLQTPVSETAHYTNGERLCQANHVPGYWFSLKTRSAWLAGQVRKGATPPPSMLRGRATLAPFLTCS